MKAEFCYYTLISDWMKFKATWKNDSAPVVAPWIISVLRGDTSGRSTMKLNPERFTFTNGNTRKDHQSESWCCLNCTMAFSSIICESLKDNQIDLGVPTQALIMVLRYVAQSVHCTMRLTKRNGSEPVLRFEFNFVDSGNCLVVHDVPIEVIKQDEAIWSEPLIPDADTRIVLVFPIKRIMSYLDHIRHMDPESKLEVRFENFVSFANMSISCACESVRTRLNVPNQQVFNPARSDENAALTGPSISDVCLSLKGFLYTLDRVSTLSDSCKCLLLASENKYLSLWIQLPNQYGSVAAITPAIIIG